jgi:hypothetical protein
MEKPGSSDVPPGHPARARHRSTQQCPICYRGGSRGRFGSVVAIEVGAVRSDAELARLLEDT